MKTYALLQNNTVYNIIETDDSGWPEGVDITDLDTRPSIGWTYDEETEEFAAPEPDDETPPPDSDPAPVRIITNLAFDRRFALAERVMIEKASIYDPTQLPDEHELAATLRVLQRRAEKAQFTDLDDPETRGGVDYMEQIGLLAQGRALEILDAPIQPDERPAIW